MRHAYFGRKLSRTKNERRRLLQGLARDLIMHNRIQTTLAKAKAVQPLVEKLITIARYGSQVEGRSVYYRRIYRVLADKTTTKKLSEEALTRFSNRQSGFTRIIKIGARLGDASEMVFLEFVDPPIIVDKIPTAIKKKISGGSTSRASKTKENGKKPKADRK